MKQPYTSNKKATLTNPVLLFLTITEYDVLRPLSAKENQT
jgi:hypothetical protein